MRSLPRHATGLLHDSAYWGIPQQKAKQRQTCTERRYRDPPREILSAHRFGVGRSTHGMRRRTCGSLACYTFLFLCYSLFSLGFNSGIAPRTSLNTIKQRGEEMEETSISDILRVYALLKFSSIFLCADTLITHFKIHHLRAEKTSKKIVSNPKSAKPSLRPSHELVIIMVIIQPQIRCRAASLIFLDRRFQSPNENLYALRP